MSVEKLIVENMDTWTTALQTRSTAGRGSSGKIDLYGIKKLRELILELAVRGKLVPQDPNDEPASELLKRIAAEKAELVKQGKIKKPKPLPEISEEEKPFELPEGWEWVRLADVYDVRDGTHDTPKYQSQGYPLVTSKNLSSGKLNFDDVKYISTEAHNKIQERSNVEFNDILFAMIGSIGNPVIVDVHEDFSIKNIALFKYYNKQTSVPSYLKYVLESLSIYLKETSTGGVQPFVSLGTLRNTIMALPPLSEQYRIVAKLTILNTLCDQLEQHSLTSLDAHQQLVETLLGTLTESQNAEELAENWARISTHFDTLFTTEASVDALKQTVLQLAVMGKLVPQDSNNEPASELLKRIAQEKALLVKDGKMKKQKPLPPISDEEKPFELPEGWEWCRIGNLVNIRPELVAPKDFLELPQVAPDIIDKGTGKVTSKRTVKESGVTGPNSRFYKGQIVYSKIRPSLSKAFLAEYDGLCSSDMYPLDCFIDSRYLLKSILSEPFLIQVRQAENRIKMPKLNIESFSNILITVPPRSEQQKIVKNIEILEAIYDTIKSRIKSAQQTQLHLADALTDAAIN